MIEKHIIEYIEPLFKMFDDYANQIVPPNTLYFFDDIKINGRFFKVKMIITDKGISYFECKDLVDLTDRTRCTIGGMTL